MPGGVRSIFRTIFILAVLVLVAGCGTPGPDPGTEDPSTGDTLAPGVTGDGITNVSSLLSAHRDTVLEAGASISLAISTFAPNDSLSVQSSQHLMVGPAGDTVSSVGSSTDRSQAKRVDAWLTATESLYRFEEPNETEYRVLDPIEARRDLATGAIDRYLRPNAEAFTVKSVSESNGTVRLTAKVDLVGGSPSPDTLMEMTVTQDGVIRSFALNQRQPDDEGYQYVYRLEELRVTPEQPDWVASVPAGASVDVDLAIDVDDGHIVNLSNHGPDTVPDGSTVTVVAGGVTYDATLLRPLETDERHWLWVDDTNGTLTARASPPDPEMTRQLGTRASIVVRSPDGVALARADLAWRASR